MQSLLHGPRELSEVSGSGIVPKDIIKYHACSIISCLFSTISVLFPLFACSIRRNQCSTMYSCISMSCMSTLCLTITVLFPFYMLVVSSTIVCQHIYYRTSNKKVLFILNLLSVCNSVCLTCMTVLSFGLFHFHSILYNCLYFCLCVLSFLSIFLSLSSSFPPSRSLYHSFSLDLYSFAISV